MEQVQTWKLVGRVAGGAQKAKRGKPRKSAGPETTYATESGTLVVRALTGDESARVLGLLEAMRAAEPANLKPAAVRRKRRARRLPQ